MSFSCYEVVRWVFFEYAKFRYCAVLFALGLFVLNGFGIVVLTPSLRMYNIACLYKTRVSLGLGLL